MAELKSVSVAGHGSCVPDKVLDNAYFEKIVETSDEWITTRTGIKERRLRDKGEAASDLAIKRWRLLKSAALVPNCSGFIALIREKNFFV